MRLFPIILYEDGAGGGAGGGANDTTNTENTESKVSTTVDVTKPLFSEAELKEFGFDTPDQLKQHLRQFKENNIPDEEKKKKADQEKANFIKYSTDQNLMTVDEINQAELLQKKADRDLVYENWLPAWKEENPGLEVSEIERLSKIDFDEEFKLNSTNEKAKSRGEARLAKEAKDLKSPFESKLNTAKKGYDDFKSMRAEYPIYKQFLTDLVTELTPDTLTLFKGKVKISDDKVEVSDKEGDDVEIPVTLTKAEREEIIKKFENQKTFASFLESKGKAKETLAPILKNKILSFLKVKHFDTVASKGYAIGKGVGLKNGSTAGAENQFGLQSDKGAQGNTEGKPDADKEFRESVKRVRQRSDY